MATTNIHLIGGEKGGVGKSLMARVLAQYMIDRQLPFLGFDTDRSHGALMRFYSAYASPIEINKAESLDAIVEAAVDQPGRRILVDLAAQTHDSLASWMEEAGVVSLADEMGMKIYYWHVMDTGKDSVDLLRRLLDRFGSGLAYVLVRNQVRGNDFGCAGPGGRVAAHQAKGKASRAEMPTSFKKSKDSMAMILPMLAPSTFRIDISRMRCWVA